MTIISGIGAAALSFRLLPPLSPARRTHRLLALTLRDLWRLATGPMPWTVNDWESRLYSRLSVLPKQAEPLHRAPLLAGLSLGTEIIRLRRLAHRFYLDAEFDAMLDALARGDRSAANERLVRLDNRLAAALPGLQGRSAGQAPGARQHSCDVRGACPAYRLFLFRGSTMSFAEINLFGVYVAPISLMMAAAWLALITLRRVADHFTRQKWNAKSALR